MNTTTTDITAAMAHELETNHAIAQTHIKAANHAIKEAVAAAEYLGQLIEKASRSKRSTVYQWISEAAGIDGATARAYKLAYTTGKQRRVASDRRCLIKLGVIQPQVKIQTKKVKAQPLSLTSKCNRAAEQITKHVETKRKVEDMSQGEKDAIKQQLEPLARLFMQVSK